MKDKGAIYLTSGYRQECISDGSEIFLGSSSKSFIKLDGDEKKESSEEIQFQKRRLETALDTDEYEDEYEEDYDEDISRIEW